MPYKTVSSYGNSVGLGPVKEFLSRCIYGKEAFRFSIEIVCGLELITEGHRIELVTYEFLFIGITDLCARIVPMGDSLYRDTHLETVTENVLKAFDRHIIVCCCLSPAAGNSRKDFGNCSHKGDHRKRDPHRFGEQFLYCLCFHILFPFPPDEACILRSLRDVFILFLTISLYSGLARK